MKAKQEALAEELKAQKERRKEEKRDAKAAKKKKLVEVAAREIESALKVEQEALQRRLKAAESLEALEQAEPSEVSSDDTDDGQIVDDGEPSSCSHEDPIAHFDLSHLDVYGSGSYSDAPSVGDSD